MDTKQDQARPRNTSQDGSWGARGSLQRSAGSDRLADAEGTPLLGNGQRSADVGEDNRRRESEWDGNADFESLSWWYRPSVYWLLPPFFLYALAFGGVLVPKLNLILSLVCRDYLVERSAADPSFVITPVILAGDNPQCRIPEVQALVAKFMLYMMVIPGILSAIMAPKLGAISDRYGRIKLLIVTSFGPLIGEVVTILAATYPDAINYRWLLLGATFDGICGSYTAGMALTHAYAADCTAPPKRAVSFGYFHACLFGGIALGPLLAAFLIKAFGTLIIIFYIALGIHGFFICFILLIVPESLSKRRQLLARARFTADRDKTVWNGYTMAWAMKKSNILAPLSILWPTGPGTSGHLRANLIMLSVVDTTIFGVAMGATTVVVYYLGYRFEWTTSDTSEFVSIVNSCRVLALVAIMPLINYLFRTRRANRQRRESGFAVPQPNSGSDKVELNIIRVSILLEIIGYGGYALASTGSVFLLSGMLASFGGIGSPTLQSALTKHVQPDKVGQLLGATGLLHALARVVSPIVFNLIYAETVGTFPQTVFVVLCAFFIMAFLVSWFIRSNVYLESTDETNADNTPSRAADNQANTQLDEEIAVVGGF